MPVKRKSRVAGSPSAKLVYLADDQPGFTRKLRGKHFAYFDQAGNRISDEDEILRINAIVIPPAWTDVWIAPKANAHLQATGRDAKGRKQYRYHLDWRAHNESTKFGHLAEFARKLPTIRAQVEQDLHRHGLGPERVLAALVRLLDTTHIRIGNDEYAKTNKSYGLTTLNNRHAVVNSTSVRFSFRGKSGKEHKVTLHDRRLARIIARCQDMPGQRLFSYLDDDGNRHALGSGDVNAYLAEISGEAITAKEFRTWAGSTQAVAHLRHVPKPEDDKLAAGDIVAAVDSVADLLGNTRAVARSSYIHPAVFEAFTDGSLQKLDPDKIADVEPGGLDDDERVLFALLKRQAKK